MLSAKEYMVPHYVQDVVTTLNQAGYPTMLVGGSVRDILLKKVPKDFDLSSTATPNQVIEIFRASPYKVIPTGIKHGTVTLVQGNRQVEITTLRIDVKCDGRHAEVAYTKSFAEDAQRRDLTINALFLDPLSGEIHDFVDGLLDLKKRVLRFVGHPPTRIAEDGLRILRIVRFYAQFPEFCLDPMSKQAIVQNKEILQIISAERIRDEFDKIITGPRGCPALQLLVEENIIAVFLPELKFKTDAVRLLTQFKMRYPEKQLSLPLSMAILMQHVPRPEETLTRLKYPKTVIRHVKALHNGRRALENCSFTLGDLRQIYIEWLAVYDDLIYFYQITTPSSGISEENTRRELLTAIPHRTPGSYQTPPLKGNEIKKAFPQISGPDIRKMKALAHYLLLHEKIPVGAKLETIIAVVKKNLPPDLTIFK